MVTAAVVTATWAVVTTGAGVVGAAVAAVVGPAVVAGAAVVADPAAVVGVLDVLVLLPQAAATKARLRNPAAILVRRFETMKRLDVIFPPCNEGWTPPNVWITAWTARSSAKSTLDQLSCDSRHKCYTNTSR